MLSGSIDATTPIANVWTPGGSEIYNSSTGWTQSGWSITKSNNNLTVNHPLNKPVLLGSTTAFNNNNLFTIPFTGRSASQMSIVNSLDNSNVKFNAITGINTGGATAGSGYTIITFFVEEA